MFANLIRFIFIVMCNLWLSFSVAATLEEGDRGYGQEVSYHIEHIDNQRGLLVINDFTYKMALDMEVYDRKGTKVNRYALRQGQRVRFDSTYKNKRHIVSKIEILPNS